MWETDLPILLCSFCWLLSEHLVENVAERAQHHRAHLVGRIAGSLHHGDM